MYFVIALSLDLRIHCQTPGVTTSAGKGYTNVIFQAQDDTIFSYKTDKAIACTIAADPVVP